MEYAELPEFLNDLKHLIKKYRSLKNDLDIFKEYLSATPRGNDSKHWNCLYKDEKVEIYKVRLACSYLRASTMRIIYAYQIDQKQIDFIELYYKGEKENENRERIKKYLKTINNIVS